MLSHPEEGCPLTFEKFGNMEGPEMQNGALFYNFWKNVEEFLTV